MKVHEIKIKSIYFDDVVSGLKSFEIRYNDRNYQVGDILYMKETLYGDSFSETGRTVSVSVTYILENALYLPQGFVIMSIKLIE